MRDLVDWEMSQIALLSRKPKLLCSIGYRATPQRSLHAAREAWPDNIFSDKIVPGKASEAATGACNYATGVPTA